MISTVESAPYSFDITAFLRSLIVARLRPEELQPRTAKEVADLVGTALAVRAIDGPELTVRPVDEHTISVSASAGRRSALVSVRDLARRLGERSGYEVCAELVAGVCARAAGLTGPGLAAG
jgi:hypothetical protein